MGKRPGVDFESNDHCMCVASGVACMGVLMRPTRKAASCIRFSELAREGTYARQHVPFSPFLYVYETRGLFVGLCTDNNKAPHCITLCTGHSQRAPRHVAHNFWWLGVCA